MIFYLPDFQTDILPEVEALHCIKVLRKGRGDQIKIADGKGNFATATILDPNIKKCQIVLKDIQHVEKPWENEIWLAVAPTKQMERMEWMVEKCTEIGLDGILFMHTARTERDTLKLDRLEKTALSAMKQSGQAWLPKLIWQPNWKAFPWAEFDHLWLADLSVGASSKLVLKGGRNLILIGPEGDFTPQELSQIKAKNAEGIRLRPQVLRTETAAIFALSMAHLS